MDVSLIIPAYNEAERIGASLEKGLAYLKQQPYSWEVVVVDDGSNDATVDVVSQFEDRGVRLLRQPGNIGKGGAVRRGMLEATGTMRIFTDADLSTPIEEVANAIEHLKTYDIAIGSRAIDRSRIRVHQPWHRETMGKVFNLFVQAVAVPGIKDTQCGFKAFRGEAAQDVFSRVRIDGFSFDVECLYIARRLGYSIIEFPVEWYNDERSTVNPMVDSMKMIQELLRIRALHRGEFTGDGATRTGSVEA